MIDLDSYQRQAEEGELHVTQVLALIAELRAIRAWLGNRTRHADCHLPASLARCIFDVWAAESGPEEEQRP